MLSFVRSHRTRVGHPPVTTCGPFCQKLVNYIKYERWETNEQLKKEVDDKRLWIETHVKDHGKPVNLKGASTSQILRYYDSIQWGMENNEIPIVPFGAVPVSGPGWQLGGNKSAEKWANQMAQRKKQRLNSVCCPHSTWTR